jgi:hypothetical protein
MAHCGCGGTPDGSPSAAFFPEEVIMNHQARLLIAGGALLTAIGVGAWTHGATAPAPAARANAAVATQPPLDQYGSPIGTAAPPDLRAAANSQGRPSAMPRSPYRATARVRNKRPLSHSVAIVGGSAGAGAAIGTLAGGRRGAGIGAISGGAAGLVYDRLTHDR